jgi:hypothetical protein
VKSNNCLSATTATSNWTKPIISQQRYSSARFPTSELNTVTAVTSVKLTTYTSATISSILSALTASVLSASRTRQTATTSSTGKLTAHKFACAVMKRKSLKTAFRATNSPKAKFQELFSAVATLNFPKRVTALLTVFRIILLTVN